MAAKCEVFMIYSKKQTNMTTKTEYVRDHRCEGTKWLTNVKELWLSPNTS